MQKNFHTLTAEQADRAAASYFANIPRYIEMLTAKVRACPGFESWQPDYSEASLQTITESLYPLIEVSYKDPATNQRVVWNPIKSDLSIPVLLNPTRGTDPHVALSQLTPQTEDWLLWVGFYFGECLRHRDPTLRWERYPNNPKDMEQNHPVLVMRKHKRYWNCYNPFCHAQGMSMRHLDGTDTNLRMELVTALRNLIDLSVRTRPDRSAETPGG